ncbi:hypothetical protein MYSTI_00593 [Myxococcus stipitatus DSM 14675]|uniref:Lipoprotein n=1 Tax=Myxococcus stipitatus (strain DSM 14675 / JCM 12634 / Mx s8) TaxID=1278073 RepID=L7U195_MYXSD|nr:hypothetical protein [Myxococcus stipitatus]AGC41943.1 hypothetical protein MYSTI_00593 [Myxococcus stipitatus DSM 14675]
MLRWETLSLGLLLFLQGCALSRPEKAPPEEAAHYKFPIALPTEGQQVLSGPIAAAVSLAMEDFLPLGHTLPSDASPMERCASRRDAYDVTAVPGSADASVVFVSFSPRESTCRDLPGPSRSDTPVVYAVDITRSRILSVQK